MSQIQQNRIADLRKAFTSRVSSLSELTDIQRNLATQSVLLATQAIPNRADYSQEHLTMLGRSLGDENAFTTHPQAEQTWQLGIVRGTFNPNGHGAAREWGGSVYDMPKEQQLAILSEFYGYEPVQSAPAGTPQPAAPQPQPTNPVPATPLPTMADWLALFGGMDQPGPEAEDNPASPINANPAQPQPVGSPVVLGSGQATTQTETSESGAAKWLPLLIAAGAFLI